MIYSIIVKQTRKAQSNSKEIIITIMQFHRLTSNSKFDVIHTLHATKLVKHDEYILCS